MSIKKVIKYLLLNFIVLIVALTLMPRDIEAQTNTRVIGRVYMNHPEGGTRLLPGVMIYTESNMEEPFEMSNSRTPPLCTYNSLPIGAYTVTENADPLSAMNYWMGNGNKPGGYNTLNLTWYHRSSTNWVGNPDRQWGYCIYAASYKNGVLGIFPGGNPAVPGDIRDAYQGTEDIYNSGCIGERDWSSNAHRNALGGSGSHCYPFFGGLSCGDGSPQFHLAYFPRSTFVARVDPDPDYNQGETDLIEFEEMTYEEYMNDYLPGIPFDGDDPKGGGTWVAHCQQADGGNSCEILQSEWVFQSRSDRFASPVTYSVGEAIRTFNNENSGTITIDFEWIPGEAEIVESMSCQELVSSTSLASITEDDIRSSDIETTLTTTIGSENISISSTDGYEYYTNIPSATFGADGSSPYTNGAETTFTIPQGTANGSYYIAVMVSGSGASDSFESGCSSATSCTGGGEGCLITLDIGEGSCNCESVTRSPSGDEIAAGSYIAYTMTAADQNGTECLVDASDIVWSTTGDPTLVEVSRDPEPVSGSTDEAVQHHIIYQLLDTAAESTEYTVSAVVDDLGQIAACADTFSVGGEPEPAFAAVKTSELECINNNTAAQITYTIHVRNISDVEGSIEYVEDTYDSRFQSSWIGSIIPSADSHSGNVIRWDNSGSGYTLAANDGASGGDDELEFSYVVTIPSDYFGAYENGVFVPYEYRNHAIVQPEDQDQIELSVLVEITCDLPITPTGIFNKAVSTGLLGILMLVVGGILVRMHSFTYKLLAPVEEVAIGVSDVLIKTYKSVNKRIQQVREKIYDRFHLTKKERFEKQAVRRADKDK